MRYLLAICLMTTLLTACISYRYAGQTYRTQTEALDAARASNDKVLSQIQPARNRVGGTLNFYMPDKKAILERGIKKTGEPRTELLDYVAESSSIAYRGLYDTLVKRGSFDRVLLHYSEGEHMAAKPGEFVVYLYQPNAENAAWFFVSDTVKREPLHFDSSKSERADKILYWLASIDALAKVK